jgi:hypothetical protein
MPDNVCVFEFSPRFALSIRRRAARCEEALIPVFQVLCDLLDDFELTLGTETRVA